MATWIVGDIHGCADELAALIDRIGLGADDRLVSVGDLFHRGPDAAGVARLLGELGARFILGNHEHVVLRRLGPLAIDDLREEDLVGDGGEPCRADAADRPALVRFLKAHSGYFLRRNALPGAGPLPDGRDWVCVHAGILPDRPPEECPIEVLTRIRRLETRGRPWWYEGYAGPDLVCFGHTPSRIPRVQRQRGGIVALGLDTGCVYGGRLTAYSPELGEFASVPSARAYAVVTGAGR